MPKTFVLFEHVSGTAALIYPELVTEVTTRDGVTTIFESSLSVGCQVTGTVEEVVKKLEAARSAAEAPSLGIATQDELAQLSHALFRNKQWLVDDRRLRTVPGEPHFAIDLSWLGYVKNDGPFRAHYYDCFVEVSKFPWVDIDLFLEAFEKAAELHPDAFNPRLDTSALSTSITMARTAVSQSEIGE